jgi:hypothetical protein
MFSTGSKLFAGLTAAAIVATVIYGTTQNFGALGGIGLVFLSASLLGIAILTIWSRDGNVSAMDDTAVATSAAAATPARGSLWPLAGALGAAVLVIGTVTDKRYFVAGIAIIAIAVAEWAVQGWSERATSDPVANEAVRGRLLHPLELPVAGAVGMTVVVYGFSRVMLAVSKEAGPAIFVVAAALITLFGFLFSAKPMLRGQMVGGICAVGATLVVAGGLAGAVSGERSELATAAEEDHFAASHRPCESTEAEEFDEDAPKSVAMKSNVWATFTFDGKLLAQEIAGPPTDTITIDRANQVSFLFKNDTDSARRLTVYGGSAVETIADIETKTPRLFCTQLIEGGHTAFLTLSLPKSSTDADPFYAYVPGAEDSKVSVVVP